MNHSKKYFFDILLLKPNCIPQGYNIYTECYMMDGFCIDIEPYGDIYVVYNMDVKHYLQYI